MDIDFYLSKAVLASIEASRAILNVYASDISVEQKADESPLTLADKRSHDIIEEHLVESNIPILSEEGKKIPFESRADWDTMWIIDPLDGTKEFINRNGEFTVNIAMVKNNRPIMGVILVPVTSTLYFAARGKGAYKLELTGTEKVEDLSLDWLTDMAAKLPNSLDSDRPYTIVGSRSHSTPELETFVEKKRAQFGDVHFVSAGSSLKFCLVAEGTADIYPRLGPTMEWDTAAGQAVAENAGAAVLIHGTGKPLTYNRPELLNPWFVVSRER